MHINHARVDEEGRGRSLLEAGGGGQVESEVFRVSVGSDTLLEAFMKKQGYDNRAPIELQILNPVHLPPLLLYSVGD